jgi:hypothetical protein
MQALSSTGSCSESVPVIFCTAGPKLLDETVISAMARVVIMTALSQFEGLIQATKRLLGWADAAEEAALPAME